LAITLWLGPSTPTLLPWTTSAQIIRAPSVGTVVQTVRPKAQPVE
jgi:hypothetical protein